MGTLFSPGPSGPMVLLNKTRLSEVEGAGPHLGPWYLLSNLHGGDSGPKPGPHVRFWPLGSHKCSCRVGPVIAGQEAASSLFITL